MTQVTPPGWYPDPGQTSDAPATERWWDGKAWTDQVRPVGSAAAGFGPPAYPPGAGPYPQGPGGHPGYPGYPGYPAPAPTPKRGLRVGIAVAVAAAVLASIGVGVYALTSNDGGSEGSTTSQGPGGQNGGPGDDGGQGGNSGGQGGPGGSGGSGGRTPGPDGSGQPPQEDGYATDTTSGISIPVPEGWVTSPLQVGAQVTTEASYDCPADPSKTCTRGGAYSTPAELLKLKATTAEAAAKEDIAQNAEDAYGSEGYGKITSHEELASKAVTVAGEKGYYVRWKVVTGKGDDGYVESLAFPSPADSSRLVVVRFGIDVSDKAPKQSVIDEITKGIKKASISGGGSGQEV
ncbi:DUF2510 domain-containing protein [Streptomyces deccanensis]|uniref:DUF2510 domain-containing protein n=1 Tax=Streptomyces deccanensis TaxID=424188 RepID=UPI001EFA911A|nr:DUF2510 domain-containing protein [Streptomyces deccanensis]ULR54738.1 DUF2510 domain-containing protein [Streptomyces deccanensis]